MLKMDVILTNSRDILKGRNKTSKEKRYF